MRLNACTRYAGGEGEPAGGPEDEEGLQELLGSDAFHALAQQLQNVVGGAGGLPDLAGLGLGGLAGEFGSLPGGAEAAAAGPRGPGAGGEEESVRSATLRGLMQQTKATVEKQSKYTRGETSGSSAAGGGRGGPSPGGFPFGDLLGKDGPLGSLMGAGGGCCETMCEPCMPRAVQPVPHLQLELCARRFSP